MKQKIFISYRRDTSFELAKSICKELEKKRNTCFFDVKSIKAGDFYQIILSKMDECDIFLLLVSDTTFDRCNDPADYVRLEIEAALERNLTIIPVMIENAVLPDKLPPSIEPIRKAHQILKRFHKQGLADKKSLSGLGYTLPLKASLSKSFRGIFQPDAWCQRQKLPLMRLQFKLFRGKSQPDAWCRRQKLPLMGLQFKPFRGKSQPDASC